MKAYLERLSKKQKDTFFIQVGSHNGKNNDPLNSFVISGRFKGILIEPMKSIFLELQKNYASVQGLIFENVAISNKVEKKTIYSLNPPSGFELPIWYDQLSSFYIDVILSHEKDIPQIRDFIIKEEVQCLTIESILEKHQIFKVDLIHIDTEGYDFEILKLIPFSRITPEIIIYEHKHLSEEDKSAAMLFLNNAGYTTIAYTEDVLALK